MDDNQVEQAQSTTDIPRVKKEHIDQLHSTLEYLTVQPPGSTTTFCHVYLPGSNGRKFLLTTGVSACVDPRLFKMHIGNEISRRNAEAQAFQELWKLEGYYLFKQLEAGNG